MAWRHCGSGAQSQPGEPDERDREREALRDTLRLRDFAWGWTEQTKFGDGTLYSWPVQSSLPVARLKRNTPMLSESWFAVISHWPDPSNWKWRGVAPRVCWASTRDSMPRLVRS